MIQPLISIDESFPATNVRPLSPTAAGRLRLCFEQATDSTRTLLSGCEQQPPLKVVRAFSVDGGETLVHLHNLSGGVLGGDRLELSIEVGPRACVQLTSTGATRLYRSRKESADAVQINDVIVAEHALLEYLPDMMIPFAGARYRQHTRINLANGAGLFWWEVVAPGRQARNEVFAYDLLQLKLDIVAEGRPVAQERIKLQPKENSPLFSLRFGLYRYFTSFYICRVGLAADKWVLLESELGALAQELSSGGNSWWGVSSLTAHGLVARGLSVSGRSIDKGLLTLWQAAKRALYGRTPLPPRKVY